METYGDTWACAAQTAAACAPWWYFQGLHFRFLPLLCLLYTKQINTSFEVFFLWWALNAVLYTKANITFCLQGLWWHCFKFLWVKNGFMEPTGFYIFSFFSPLQLAGDINTGSCSTKQPFPTAVASSPLSSPSFNCLFYGSELRVPRGWTQPLSKPPA